MLFNSLSFLVFFPVVCILYYLLPQRRMRNVMLLVASYYFYMNWEPVYALLILTSTVLTYGVARLMERSSSIKARKWILGCGIGANLGILLFYKYYHFIGENLQAVMGSLGIEMPLPDFALLLPVGISFYTFQALGYVIDVYRGRIDAEHDFVTYALFVSFFPQLVAGPIERSTRLLPQFKTDHHFNDDEALQGLRLMLWGYFLKLVVADRCALYADPVFDSPASHPGYSTIVAAVLFCFQIYGDFAGYTYVAIGSARIMGFHLMDNFNRPYLATSIKDFWRRWHISLTSWFTDYVYIPLGGNRCSKLKHHRNLLLTFLLSGLWHGADWTFVLWGTYHGVLLSAYNIKKQWRDRILPRHVSVTLLNVVVTFVFAMIGWVLFRANRLQDIPVLFGQFGSLQNISLTANNFTLSYSLLAIGIMLTKEIIEERGMHQQWVARHQTTVATIWMITLCMLILWLGVWDGGQFIYFQF